MPFAYQPLTSTGPLKIIVTLSRRLKYDGACRRADRECVKLQEETPNIIGFLLWEELRDRKGYVLDKASHILGTALPLPYYIPELEDAGVVL